MTHAASAVPDVLAPGVRLVLRSIPKFPTPTNPVGISDPTASASDLRIEERELDAGRLNYLLSVDA
jgi:hypothetical protein